MKKLKRIRAKRSRYRNNLFILMRLKDISEKKLSEMTGLKQPYINAVKNGHVMPIIRNARRISRALGETIEIVFGDI